jgi:hypothetical protein
LAVRWLANTCMPCSSCGPASFATGPSHAALLSPWSGQKSRYLHVALCS